LIQIPEGREVKLQSRLRPGVIALSEVQKLERNPKRHDLESMSASMKRFGFIDRIVINEVTGHLIAGHGRIDALLARKETGEAPPEGIMIERTEDGYEEWLIPCDYVQIAPTEEEAAAIALNRIGERGGWDEEELSRILEELSAESSIEGLGFSEDEIEALLGAIEMDLSDLEFHEASEESEEIICPKCGFRFRR
jgi:ParB-like chromosome segregation protein Spo0J